MNHTFRFAPAGDDTRIPHTRSNAGDTGGPHLLWPGHRCRQLQESDVIALTGGVVLGVCEDLSHSPRLQALLATAVNASVNTKGGGWVTTVAEKV